MSTATTKELAVSFVDRINSLHADNQELDNNLRFTFLRKLNQTREVGLLIQEAKASLGTKGWEEAQGQLQFGPEPEKVVQIYLNFARKQPELITDVEEGIKALDDALMVTGMLPFPETHGHQTPHPQNFFSWAAKTFMSLNAEIKKRLGNDSPENWTQSAAEQFIAQIEPVIERINGIYAQAKEKARQSWIT